MYRHFLGTARQIAWQLGTSLPNSARVDEKLYQGATTKLLVFVRHHVNECQTQLAETLTTVFTKNRKPLTDPFSPSRSAW